jgi:ABC-type nickel/cobalt efflux system permease component RcnA
VFFTPKRRSSARRLLGQQDRDRRTRREHATALLVTASIQAALAIALLVAAAVAYGAVQTHARDVDATLRLGLPGLFVVAALITTRSAVRNLRLARAERASADQNADPTPP